MQAPTATEPLDSLLVPVPEEKVKEVLEVVQARLCAHLHAGASLLYIGDAIDPELYVFETGAGVVEPPIPTKFSIGEGFLGQVVKEKRPLSERVSTQMLGHSVSTALLQNTEIFISAIPLLYQEQVEGVWCIASEGDILSTLAEPTWQDFLYKWAAYLQTLRSRRYIQSLLEKTQIQNQELITREEELRQNLEELAVTQEEMRRAQQLLSKQRDSQNFIIDLFTLMAAAVPHNLRSISRIFLAQLSQYFHGEGAALLYHTDKGWHTLFSWSSKRAGISFPTQWNIPSAILEGLERSRQAGCYSAADLGIEGDKNYWLVIPYFTPTGLSGMTLMAFSEPFAMTSYDARISFTYRLHTSLLMSESPLLSPRLIRVYRP